MTSGIPPQVAEAARAHGLGAPVTSEEARRRGPARCVAGPAMLLTCFVVIYGLTTIGVRSPWIVLPVPLLSIITVLVVVECWIHSGGVLYLYERGAVIGGRRCAARVVPWTGMQPCEHVRPRRFGGALPALTIRVGPEAAFTCVGAAADRLADVIAALEQPRARALLAAAGTLDYGIAQITRDAIVLDRCTVPWAGVTGMWADQWTLQVFGRAGAPVLLLREGVAHQRTLLALGHELADRARI